MLKRSYYVGGMEEEEKGKKGVTNKLSDSLTSFSLSKLGELFSKLSSPYVPSSSLNIPISDFFYKLLSNTYKVPAKVFKEVFNL